MYPIRPVGTNVTISFRFVVVASTAMSAACLSAIVLGSFVSGLVILCRKLGRDPDNIVPPITSCLSDLVTMFLLGAMSTVLTLWIGTAAPYVVIAVVTLCAIAAVSVVRRNEHVRPLLSTGWSPLLGAVVVSSASGRVLDAFVGRYEGYAMLAVAFGGLPGGAGSIFVSRLSTALHAAGSVIAPRHYSQREPSPRLVMLVLFLVSIPVAIAFFSILRISSWLTTPLMFTVLALFFLFTSIAISLSVAYVLTTYLWSHNYDPDMYALPIHSALMDLVGELLLVACFELASAIGLHVRSH
jgi:solute carrier family 41